MPINFTRPLIQRLMTCSASKILEALVHSARSPNHIEFKVMEGIFSAVCPNCKPLFVDEEQDKDFVGCSFDVSRLSLRFRLAFRASCSWLKNVPKLKAGDDFNMTSRCI